MNKHHSTFGTENSLTSSHGLEAGPSPLPTCFNPEMTISIINTIPAATINVCLNFLSRCRSKRIDLSYYSDLSIN